MIPIIFVILHAFLQSGNKMQAKTITRISKHIDIKLIITAILIISLSACGRREKNPDEMCQPEEFHADNDIAMTVRSIADAINVGEPLDTTDYDFEGILTDGQGRPLYTDIHGNPGEWSIDVTSPESVVIRNSYQGDLLTDDLQDYLVQSLELNQNDRIVSNEYDDDYETEMDAFNFGKGTIRFEKRKALASNGVETIFLNIVMQANS